MRKIVIHKPGDYRVLKLEEHPDFIPGDDDIIVSVKAAGVNYADIIIRWGLYESAKRFVGWPITPGFEYAGTVKSTGKNVKKFKVGERVLGVALFNSYASEVKTSEGFLYHLPESMSFEQGAGFPAVMLTAYHALLQNVVVRTGMTALIHSAAGGVGSSLVQLCRIKGIKSIGVIGSPHKRESLSKFGCTHIIDKSSEDLWKKVEEYAPEGVDLAFDANGVSTMKESYKHLASSGKLFIYGAHSMFPKTGGKVNWPKLVKDYLRSPRFNPLEMTSENKSIITFNLSFLFNRVDLFSEAMTDLLKWYEEGKLQAPDVQSFSAVDVGKAHQALESGKTVGKIVLTF